CERGEHAGLAACEAAAMKAGRVAEDERALRRGERPRTAVDPLGQLVLRRIVLAERPPRPELVELAAGSAARDVLERAGLLVDVDEVEEGLQEMAVVEVAVPALRRPTLLLACRRRVPDVHVLELRPHPEIRVRVVEQSQVNAEAQPGVLEPELHVAGVLADEELLARPAPERPPAALALAFEAGLGLGDEVLGVALEVVPDRGLGDELSERE